MGNKSSNNKKQNQIDIGLKIHIFGDNPRKKDMIEQIFYIKKISNKQYINRASRELKTDQFYWIAKLYENFTDNTINEIMQDIMEDDRNIPSIKQQVILYFTSENNKDLLLSSFNKIQNNIFTPFIIIVSKNRIESSWNIDKRRITNIIYERVENETLKNRIISSLWDYDCYYNEKGNEICRYIPENIFKSLDESLSYKSVNILLTGMPGSGKSTFINFLSNKLVALETGEREPVTKAITEYYIYPNQNYNKFEHAAIKLIDTPGILRNTIGKSKELLENLINNKDNNIKKQIHFILFFFMEGDSIEGIDDIFNLLNNCHIPVLFIINKALDDSDDGKTKDIAAIMSYLRHKNFFNFNNLKNFIGINIVKSKRIPCFGVEDIFKRLYNIYRENNKFNVEIENNIKECINIYVREVLNKVENISDELIKKIDELKKYLNNEIDMFKYLNLNNIIKNGVNHTNKWKNIINYLINILGENNIIKYDNINTTAISIFQAFMVIEIGEMFGYNINAPNFNLKSFIMEIKKQFDKDDFSLPDKNKIIINNIHLRRSIIENFIKNELEVLNIEIVMILCKIFTEIKEKYKIKNNNKINEDTLNIIITDEIYYFCINYMEDKLKKTNGLLFLRYYYDICHKILNILEEYSKMDFNSNSWDKKENKVIEE